MANDAWKNPSGGFWPLGQFTITSGTPISLATNVGVQTQGYLPGNSRLMTRQVRGFIFSFPQGNSGAVYVMKAGAPPGQAPTHPYTDTNSIIAIIPSGSVNPVSLPPYLLEFTTETVDDIALDGTGSGDVVTVTAIR